MPDTDNVPGSQPQTPSSSSSSSPSEELPSESLMNQISGVFLSKKFWILFGIFVVFMYFVLCVQGERLLRQGVYDMFKQLGQDGFGISYQAPSSYVDFKSGLNLDELVITAPEKMGGWTLKAGRVSVSSTPFQPHKIILEFNGTHSLTTKTIGDIRLIVGQGELVVNLANGETPFSMMLFLKQVQAASPKSMDGFYVSDGNLMLVQPSAKKEKEEMTVALRIETMRLPAYLRRHLPPVMQEFDLKGVLTAAASDGSKSFLKSWQDDNGTVEVEQGIIKWSPFAAQFNGTFGADDSFSLMGAGIAKTYGFFELLDKLREGDYLRSKRVSVAKVVLGSQLKTEKNEKIPSLTSAFSFQSGKIYVGQVLLRDANER